jgi:hypothetical protein
LNRLNGQMVNPCLTYSKAYLGIALPSIIVAGSAPGVATGSGPADGSRTGVRFRCALSSVVSAFPPLAKILARGNHLLISTFWRP